MLNMVLLKVFILQRVLLHVWTGSLSSWRFPFASCWHEQKGNSGFVYNCRQSLWRKVSWLQLCLSLLLFTEESLKAMWWGLGRIWAASSHKWASIQAFKELTKRPVQFSPLPNTKYCPEGLLFLEKHRARTAACESAKARKWSEPLFLVTTSQIM